MINQQSNVLHGAIGQVMYEPVLDKTTNAYKVNDKFYQVGNKIGDVENLFATSTIRELKLYYSDVHRNVISGTCVADGRLVGLDIARGGYVHEMIEVQT